MSARPVTHWLPDNSGLTATYVAAKVEGHFGDIHYAWGCFTDDARLIGGIVVYNVDAINAWGAIALEKGCVPTRALLREIMGFLLNLGLRRFTVATTPSNTRAQKLNELMGFKREGLLRRAAPNGDDLILYGILQEDFRYPTKTTRS